MTTDDRLSDFVGAQFVGVDIYDGPETITEDDEPHETQFLIVHTSLGDFTMEMHNEHNGYYGGFLLTCADMQEER